MTKRYDIIKFRRGTAAEWAASEPQPSGEILKLGEPGYEKDTGKLKIGDGITPWNSLDYVAGGSVIVVEDIDHLINEVIQAGSGISLNFDDSNDTLTISTTGTYSEIGHLHEISDVNGLQIALDSKQPSGVYASGIHDHTSSDITDFNSSVSGLLPPTYDAAVPWTANHTLVDGTRYLVNDLVYESGYLYRANYDNESIPVSDNLYWTNVGTGYRLNIDGRDILNIPYPVTSVNSQTGDVDITSIDISDFNSGVSGLLPSVTGSDYIISSFANNSYTISVTGLQPSGNYSVSGHSHIVSDITDFNNSVSGLLVVKDIIPGTNVGVSSSSGIYTISSSGTTINNYGNNRILTSDGTLTGINAESSVVVTDDGTLNPTNGAIINDNAKSLNFGPNRPTALQIFNVSSLNQNEASEASLSWSFGIIGSGVTNSSIIGSTTNALIAVPSGTSNNGILIGNSIGALRNALNDYDDNGSLLLIVGQGISYGNSVWGNSTSPSTSVARGLSISPFAGKGSISVAYDIYLGNTSYDAVVDGSGTIKYGDGTISNRYGIYQESPDPNILSGSLSVGSGLSAPTPIYNLGTVSGNTAINYSIDKQIQKVTLNGSSVNFTEGTGWDVADKSVDVLLEITVSSLTTVAFDSSFITDWYNPLPTFEVGKYLILLRSMGSGVVQGHYVGIKTN